MCPPCHLPYHFSFSFSFFNVLIFVLGGGYLILVMLNPFMSTYIDNAFRMHYRTMTKVCLKRNSKPGVGLAQAVGRLTSNLGVWVQFPTTYV